MPGLQRSKKTQQCQRSSGSSGTRPAQLQQGRRWRAQNSWAKKQMVVDCLRPDLVVAVNSPLVLHNSFAVLLPMLRARDCLLLPPASSFTCPLRGKLPETCYTPLPTFGHLCYDQAPTSNPAANLLEIHGEKNP